MRSTRFAMLLGTVSVAALPTGLHAQSTAASPAARKVAIEQNVHIPMRDGVELVADIYRPETPGTYPALVLRTPYNKASPDEIENSKWYASHGYVVVNQDVRGRHASPGTFYTYAHEADDGYDTDAWIAKQPWSNGSIGTLGGSYLGYTGLTQAIRAHPALKSVATDVTSVDIYNSWVYSDGAFITGFALPWGAGIVDGRDMSGGGAFVKPEAYAKLPVATADAASHHINQPYRDWLAHPLRTDPYWNNISFEDEVTKIAVPTLVVTGWYDIFLRGALTDHARIRANGATALARTQKRLVIGPWTHFKTIAPRINDPSLPTTGPGRSIDFGPDAAVNGNDYYLRWHDHWLKGIANGVDKEAPVRIFVMGANIWRDEQQWPLARTRYTKYYIDSAGRANSARGDGLLSTTPPKGNADSYAYDPAKPVQTLGGNVCCSSVPSGPRDHQAVEARDDVLVYSTPVLTEAVEVTGPIKAKLFAASSAKDTDWVVRLVDVHPDGFVQTLQDGIVRARYRHGTDKPGELIEPGKVYEYDIDMWATSNLFKPGHRIRVEITSSNFPRFDRNLNTGEDPATSTRMEVARQTIHHSARYPSHVILPIIPR